MSKKQKLGAIAALAAAVIGFLGWQIHKTSVAVLQPRGTVGAQEKHLIIVALLLSMIVVIPVYVMLFGFAWRYRAGNKKARYQPDFDRSRLFESIWWGVPIAIISILGVITFHSSHDLDPFKPLKSPAAAMTIQVVALDWKWLFIYPDENVASVNLVQLPVNTPVKFAITSDAPMNSFWIPQLGGQIYAMSGMETDLNLQASKSGDYQGVSANISGDGFAGMRFTARASSQAAFDDWIKSLREKPDLLTRQEYNRLAKPSQNDPVRYFGWTQAGLFDSIIAKYQAPITPSPEAVR